MEEKRKRQERKEKKEAKRTPRAMDSQNANLQRTTVLLNLNFRFPSFLPFFPTVCTDYKILNDSHLRTMIHGTDI